MTDFQEITELQIALHQIERLKQEVLKAKQETMALYRDLAGAELSARLGWERYKAANRAHISLQMKYAEQWGTK